MPLFCVDSFHSGVVLLSMVGFFRCVAGEEPSAAAIDKETIVGWTEGSSGTIVSIDLLQF